MRRPGRMQSGWYRDPADPTLLRHWGGGGWDGRRRHVPAWSLAATELDAGDGPPRAGPDGAVYEGPVREAALPAAASTAPGAARRVPLAARPDRRPGAHPLSPGRHAMQGRGAVGGRGWSRSRHPLAAALALLGVVAVTMAGSIVGTTRRDPRLPALAPDTAFLRRADVACATAIGGVRIQTPTAISPAGVAGGVTVSAVDAANNRLDVLAGRIRALATADGLTAAVAPWLSDWYAYATARRRSAAFDAADPRPTGAAARSASTLATMAGSDATRADRFARANGLAGCSLVGSSTPAIEQIP
jgi:hypothetical protein